jgi:hypothetical protein
VILSATDLWKPRIIASKVNLPDIHSAKICWLHTDTYGRCVNDFNKKITWRILFSINVFRIISLTHSWSWALLEKLPIVQPLKKFSAFYGTRRFITMSTRALHWSLSWARTIQSTPYHPIALRSILILSTHLRLGLPSGLLPFGSPTNILYAFPLSPIRATCSDHLIQNHLGLQILRINSSSPTAALS